MHMIARSSPLLGRFRRFAARLRRDTKGLALIEFAFTAPIMLTLGLYGLEAANLALVHMRMSQITSNLADTSSRIGLQSSLALKQIRESDIDDSFQAVLLQGGAYNVTTTGRFILSSLERNSSGGQWVHWQRCIGMGKDSTNTFFASSYGTQGTGATGTAFAGMGPTGSEIQAPTGNAVMFVEAYYVYKPLVSSRLFGTPTIHTTASFIVRDVRNLVDPNDPVSDGGISMTCNKHTATVS
jgi:Flp pilus assembly protein TadG